MARGFTRTSRGFRAWVRVASARDGFNVIRTKRFPPDTTPQQIRDWRADTRTALQGELEARRRQRAAVLGTASSGFRYDALRRYLPAVQAMPTYKQRVKDIQLWIDVFGDRDRHTIQPHEIRAVRDRWLTEGPKRRWRRVNGVGQWVDVPEPLSASSVNHRLRALSHLWTVLDGRHAPNPVREVPEADEPQAVPRAIDYDTIRQILEAMPDRGPAPSKGAKPRDYSLAKARARVMAWTGITPGELALLTPDNVHWEERLLVVPGRRKGRGAPGRVVPLGPDALEALREFDRLQAWGAFNQRNVLRAWHAASRAVLGQRARLYDLRHSFLTGIVRSSDLTTAQLLAGHLDPRTTRRYATAAMLPMLRAGVDAFAASVRKPDTERNR